MKKISQREARRLKQLVARLENQLDQQRRSYASSWPSSKVIARICPDTVTLGKVETARLLGHAVVVVPDGPNFALFAAELRA